MSLNYFQCLYAVRVNELCEVIRSVKSFGDANLRIDNHGEYGRSVTIVGVGWQARGVKTLMNRLTPVNNRWERNDRKHDHMHLRACTGEEVGNVRIDLAWM
jgi:hypothetical protein